MYRGPSFGHHPVGGFYPSLAGIFPAQLCPPKNIVFSLRLRAVTLNACLHHFCMLLFENVSLCCHNNTILSLNFVTLPSAYLKCLSWQEKNLFSLHLKIHDL